MGIIRIVLAAVLAANGPDLAKTGAGGDARARWSDTRATEFAADLWCVPERMVLADAGPALPAPDVPVVIVGFTGGREGRDADRSGVVRLGHSVADSAKDDPNVTVRLYNNAEWPEAGRDILDIVQRSGVPASAPLVVAYGHSLGGGSIGRLARMLEAEGVDIDLAVYIDAFGVRNPRLPANIRQAVNFYQRTGLLRGLPLRGKRKLIPEDPDATTLLGSYRMTPDTPVFGWRWSLMQPLLYRQHHRLAHDARIRDLLVTVAGRDTHANSAGCAPAPAVFAADELITAPQ